MDIYFECAILDVQIIYELFFVIWVDILPLGIGNLFEHSCVTCCYTSCLKAWIDKEYAMLEGKQKHISKVESARYIMALYVRGLLAVQFKDSFPLCMRWT